MATKTGRGWRGDKLAHREAGSAGGQATAKTQGRAHFSRIGTKGGALSGGNFKHNIELAKKAGKRSVQKRREANARNWPKKAAIVQALYNDKTNSIEDICKKLNISLSTLYRYIKGNRHIIVPRKENVSRDESKKT